MRRTCITFGIASLGLLAALCGQPPMGIATAAAAGGVLGLLGPLLFAPAD